MKNIWKKTRGWLGRKLFKAELDFVDRATKQVEEELEKLEGKEGAFQKSVLEWRNKQSITELVREQLHGFDPRFLDNPEDDVLSLVERDGRSVDEFLSQMNNIAGYWGFAYLCDYLTREQILHSAKFAPDLRSINFGRASLNGVSLAREEVDRLAGIHRERTAPAEDFDPTSVV